MPRPIDHLVLAVPDLAAAADLYRAIGFTVGGVNRHPWGTENVIIQLDGTFLEIIGLAEDFNPPAPEDPAADFACAVAAVVARGGGLAALAFRSTDADADAARFVAAGIGRGHRLDFGRSAEAPDGSRRDVRFSLAFVDDPSLSEAGLFTCRHHHPENFWNAAARRHANGTLRLDGVHLAADDPERHRATLALVCDAVPAAGRDGLRFDTGTGAVVVSTPERLRHLHEVSSPSGRFAGFGVIVDGLDPVRVRLATSGLPHTEGDGTLQLPPSSAFGVALAFTTVPCHSDV